MRWLVLTECFSYSSGIGFVRFVWSIRFNVIGSVITLVGVGILIGIGIRIIGIC